MLSSNDIVSPTTVENTYNATDSKSFAGLANALKLNLQMQKMSDISVATDIWGYQDGLLYENVCTVLRSGYAAFSDDSPIPAESKYGLCVIFNFRVHNKFNKRGFYRICKVRHDLFKNLKCFSLFLEHVTFDEDQAGKWNIYEYFIDFGDDYEKAACLISDVIHNVYGVPYRDSVDCHTNSGENIDKFRKEFDKRVNGFLSINGIYKVKKLSDREYDRVKRRMKERGIYSKVCDGWLFFRRHIVLYYLMLLLLLAFSIYICVLFFQSRLN